jgi:hypothetical protein
MIPTEEIEWEKLANWLRANNYIFTHIANEIGIRGHIWMLVNKKKVKQWLSKWFPDYCIILKKWALLFLELKRQKRILKNWKLWASPSIISEEQKKWRLELSKIKNVQCEFAYWADHWIEIIKHLE